MSGGRTPRRGSDKQLKYISNLIPGTTCRHHMPYVVAYVVGHVEGGVVYSSLAKASTRPCRGFASSMSPKSCVLPRLVLRVVVLMQRRYPYPFTGFFTTEPSGFRGTFASMMSSIIFRSPAKSFSCDPRAFLDKVRCIQSSRDKRYILLWKHL